MPFIEHMSKLENRKGVFFLLLFLSALIFRSPTLFNDYYDVDELAAIVQTREYISGGIPGKDFRESKKPLYHQIFKISYKISDKYGYAIVHFATILFVLITSIFIYLIGLHIYNFNIGAFAAFAYSIFISSFNKDFMATNGEIIYNLFLAGGLYFIVRSLSVSIFRKILLIVLSIFFGFLAYQVKFHGIILFIYIIFLYCFYLPYNKYSTGLRSLLKIAPVAILSLIVFYFIAGIISPEVVINIKDKLGYAMAPDRKFAFINFISRYIYRQGLFSLWHMLLWAPAFVYMYRFIKNNFRAKSIQESSIAIFFIITYLMIFGGFARLYYHYFMPSYIGLSLIFAFVLFDSDMYKIKFIRERLVLLLLIPSIFFLTWNIKDIMIKNYFPGAFYNEGNFLFWARAVLTGRYNEYLLPNVIYKNAINYIHDTTKKGDSIFVWGNGPEIYYFSKRKMGAYDLWPKGNIYNISKLYKNGGADSVLKARRGENFIIDRLKLKKPLLFIDTSKSIDNKTSGLKLLRPAYFDIPLSDAPGINKYVNEKYIVEKEIDGIIIYRRKK